MPNSDSGGGHPTSFVFRTRRAQLEKRLGRPLSEAELTFLADTLDQPFEAVASRLESETPPTTSSKAPAVRDTPLFRQLAAGLHAKLKRPPSESELLALEATLTKGRKAAAFVRPADAFAAPEAAPPPSPHPPVPPAAPPPRALEPHVRADLAKRTGYTAEEVQGFELAAQRLAQRRLEGHAPPPRQQAGPTQLADLLPRAMAPASTTTGSGAVSPALEGARQAVLELGARLEAITANEVRHHRARAQAASKKHVQKRFRRVVDDVAEQVHEALAEKRIGPRLQPYQLRCSAIYVQQEDLDDIVPDGWGTTMPLEASRLARRIGLPPAAVPLLCLLTWTSSFADASVRDKHECGAGFQVSIAWLARKLGCTDTWVKQLLNRLDPCARWRRDVAHVRKANKQRQRKGTKALPEPQRPQGPVYIHRFRRLVRYEGPLRANGKPASIWVDSEGRPHRHVDIRGVVYLTSTGRRALVRRASHHRSRAQLEGRAPTPLRPVGYRADVWGRGNRRRWLIAARLRRGRSLLDGGHPDELLRSRREIEDAPALSAELPPSYTTFFRKKHLRGPPD